MAFRYKSLFDLVTYENIEPLAQIQLAWTYDYQNQPIIANYQGNIEYFYSQQIYSYDENFDVEAYITSLPIIKVEDIEECRGIVDLCLNRKMGNLEFYLRSQAFTQEYLSTLPTTTISNTTTSTSTSTTVSNSTTPCPSGVLSREYYLNLTNECAICVPANEFICSPNENYNYQSCLYAMNNYNYGNTNCTGSTSTTISP